MKYEIGRRVINIQDATGVIIKTDDTIYPYLVKLNNGDVEWCAESDLISDDLQVNNERLKAVIQELIDPAWTTSFNSDWNTTDCIWCGAIRRISGWEDNHVSSPIWEEIGHREDCPVTKAQQLLGLDQPSKGSE